MVRPVHRVVFAALLLVCGLAGLPATQASAASGHLVATWSASSDRLPTAIGDQTIRMVVRTTIGGTGLRIRLSNVYGRKAVTFKSAFVGLQAYGAELESATNQLVTFNKKRSIRLQPGQAVWSDPVMKKVAPSQNLTISLYVPGYHAEVTGHERAYATTFLSDPGNHAGDETAGPFTYTSTQWYFVDRVAVTTSKKVRSVVALGDSLTDGAGQNTDANRRWTDYLYQRMSGLPAAKRMSVINAGIAGNQVLRWGTGPSALSRYYRDVLSQPGVKTVVIFEGVNDISKGGLTSAAPLINAYKKMIKLAHAKKLRVLGATLTPFSGYSSWTPERERVRQQVNKWIRTSKAFDGVLDFDRAVRDPEFPEQLLGSYDHGDHLHLSDAGRRKLAYTVRLSQVL
ncbi:SGNH/GDSL hydrolase family protein [Acrocarpospora catenulata]|uniref:SGNH/GDSL hydrolase family protein n=1 Tax=Acrocarpospora catenulata TaxID=2836182 RepID=UPI001BDA42A6|nr:SGNH/GDSL hydrolase family protein [Acrocarpospora catenulata]